MQILNNAAAMAALGELKKNDTALGKQLKKVASGMKLNGASDGTAEYAISEKMRVRLRSLGQDIVNAQTGKNLVRTAEGGIQEILNNLRDMKAKAIDAANDHNTDEDRAIIQKEQDSRIQTIDDIANSTSYNGKLLLNGLYGKKGTAARTSETSGTDGGTKILQAGDQTIAADGTYILAKGFTGHITINAKNVTITQEDPMELLYKTSMECTNAGSSLTLDGLTIIDGSTTHDARIANFQRNVVKFTGSGNELRIKNHVNLTGGCNGYDPDNDATQKACINIGEGLSIIGDDKKSVLEARVQDGYSGNPTGAGIGTDEGQKTSGSVSISGLGKLNVWSEMGAGIGAGVNSTMGNIEITNVDEIICGTRDGAGIGAAENATVGDITISAKGLWGRLTTKDGAAGTILGKMQTGASCGSVSVTANYIFLATVDATPSKGTATSGLSSSNGHTILGDAVTINGQSYDGNGRTYKGFIIQTNDEVYEYDDDTLTLDEDPQDSKTEEQIRGLIIHTGTKSDQHLFVTINSMDPVTLGIDGIKMRPRENAVASLIVLDAAIDYALNENTRMGAYQTRLDYTADNLTTSNENTQASESTIRDADMAKEMTAYTKANVLAQASQAMLAQANQNASSVLQFLQ